MTLSFGSPAGLRRREFGDRQMAGSEWVPLPVRQYVRALIDGDELEPYGRAAAIREVRAELKKAEKELHRHPADGDVASWRTLAREVATQRQYTEGLKRNIDVLGRLVSDERMRDAYDGLKNAFTDDWQWKGFAAAAWAADMDYRQHRERMRLAREHVIDIADAATRLADLLDKNFGVSWPSSFGDVATLLRTTDNHEMQNHNLAMWSVMRWRILGFRSRPGSADSNDGSGSDAPTRVVVRTIVDDTPAERDPVDSFLEDIRYAWGVAPSLSALLRTLAREASHFEPTEFGPVAAATIKRQHNIKTEYIRAFAHLLGERHIPLSADVQKAMAITATVVLNGPDLVVSFDDVRKALQA